MDPVFTFLDLGGQRVGYWGDKKSAAVASKIWEIQINSVIGGGKQVELTEATFMKSSTQLGRASSVFPTIISRGTLLHINPLTVTELCGLRQLRSLYLPSHRKQPKI